MGGGSSTSWQTGDPLFEIGNGTSTNNTSDALVVYKNGNMVVSGTNNSLPNQSLTGSTNSSILTEGMGNQLYGALSSVNSLNSTVINLTSGITVGTSGVVLDGTNNTMPNQSLAASTSNSILTEGMGNTLYVSSSTVTTGTNGQLGIDGGHANGSAALAIGTGTFANAQDTLALGGGYASAPYAVAIGLYSGAEENCVSIGRFANDEITGAVVGATAIGYNSQAGAYSTALGYNANANGAWSESLGGYASGPSSVALGPSATATGLESVAIGYATASGYYATASGCYTTAQSYDSFVVGRLNAGASGTTSNSWVYTDPLFEVGNGNWGTVSNDYTPTFSDALVVYKNGNAAVQGTVSAASFNTSGTLTAGGVITAQPGGSIPMYTGQ